jgi:ElaB/YqjD/DUF883 family membrane-anchored ribosome-binding protein
MLCIAENTSRLIRYAATLWNMVANKASKNPHSKEQLEKIASKAAEAAQEVKDRLHSATIAIEQRVAIEDYIHSISREMEYLLDSIDDISRKNQKNILSAYKKFLEESLKSVDNRLKELS